MSKDNDPKTERITELRRLREPFPASAISKLPRKFKDKNGNWQSMDLDYVGHADLTERFLEVDPEWSWEPLGRDELGMPILTMDKAGNPIGLWIRLTILGRSMIGYGSCEAGKQEAVKELIGDALRNAGMRMGAALDLWKKTGPIQARASAEAALQPQAAPAPRKSAPKPPPANINPDTGEIMESDDLASAIDSMFGGDTQAEAPGQVYGLALTIPYDPEAALEQKFSFGKHSGKTIRELVDDPDPKGGRSYLEWMKKKTVEEASQGKKASTLNQACVIAYHAFIDGK